jgi:hypothetical protein
VDRPHLHPHTDHWQLHCEACIQGRGQHTLDAPAEHTGMPGAQHPVGMGECCLVLCFCTLLVQGGADPYRLATHIIYEGPSEQPATLTGPNCKWYHMLQPQTPQPQYVPCSPWLLHESQQCVQPVSHVPHTPLAYEGPSKKPATLKGPNCKIK